jgi:hypothetical protein
MPSIKILIEGLENLYLVVGHQKRCLKIASEVIINVYDSDIKYNGVIEKYNKEKLVYEIYNLIFFLFAPGKGKSR